MALEFYLFLLLQEKKSTRDIFIASFSIKGTIPYLPTLQHYCTRKNKLMQALIAIKAQRAEICRQFSAQLTC